MPIIDLSSWVSGRGPRLEGYCRRESFVEGTVPSVGALSPWIAGICACQNCKQPRGVVFGGLQIHSSQLEMQNASWNGQCQHTFFSLLIPLMNLDVHLLTSLMPLGRLKPMPNAKSHCHMVDERCRKQFIQKEMRDQNKCKIITKYVQRVMLGDANFLVITSHPTQGPTQHENSKQSFNIRLGVKTQKK